MSVLLFLRYSTSSNDVTLNSRLGVTQVKMVPFESLDITVSDSHSRTTMAIYLAVSTQYTKIRGKLGNGKLGNRKIRQR